MRRRRRVEFRHSPEFATGRATRNEPRQGLGVGILLAVLSTAMVMKIECVEQAGMTVFMLVGSMGSQEVQQLKAQIGEARERVVLDLYQLRLVGLDAAHFLAEAERSGVELRRVPRYVREWIELEQLPMKG